MESRSFRGVSAAAFCALIAVAAVAQDAGCTLNASNTGPYNAGSTVSLYASSSDANATTYSWSGPNNFSSYEQNPTIANIGAVNAGTYSVTSNGCTATTTVVVNPDPTINITNASGKPGPRGTTTQLVFQITLSAPSTQTVSVEYYTSNQTALAGRDYQYTVGTAIFQPGETSKDVAVNIYGTSSNTQKTFLVTLYEPENATIATLFGYNVRGKGTILAK